MSSKKFKFHFNQNFLDDMCHLAPYAKNLVAKHDTQMTRYFSELRMAVDFLHFKVESQQWKIMFIIFIFCQNHVGKNCKKFYTPHLPHQYPDLLPVNSVVCEQQVNSQTLKVEK